ncbi:MAG: hypothetical protein HY925_07520 [Elusimicrobia bacterium]|nr:hypothetical protein [Elusimicrobiota bacterium]
MAAPKAPFTPKDAFTAAAIAGVTLVLVASILMSAERVKRDSAESIVDAIASANKKRILLGKPAVTGRVDDSSVLVAEGEIDGQEWDKLPYLFTGAEKPREACILAAATRRSDGPAGSSQKPYDRWGVCSSAKGETAAFEGGCPLDCREEAPPPPPVASPPVVRPQPPPPVVTPRRAIVVEMPELAPDKPAKKQGCSATGCFGTSCCDTVTDRCAACPGAACCAQMSGCNGTCQSEEDCTIGCSCVKLPGSPWGNCRGK